MVKPLKKMIILLLIFIYSCTATTSFLTFAATKEDVSKIVNDTADYLLKTVPNPQFGYIGGDWIILGLAQCSYNVPQEYFNKYYQNVEKYVIEQKGIVHEKKYTEYSRIIIALTSIGKDPSNIGGYNLLEPFGDFDKTVFQGINGPIFALIALDCGNYEIPYCKTAKKQATREMYIDEILSRQLDDGGFALSGNKADADTTAIALQALAKYKDRKDVKSVIDKALAVLSSIQDSSGGFKGMGIVNTESTAQVLSALCELGIDYEDSRFVKKGKTIVDSLVSCYTGDGGFMHSVDAGGVSLMSTEQTFIALVNLERILSGKTSFYRVRTSPVKTGGLIGQGNSAAGLPGKNADVKIMPVIQAGRTFSDIKGHFNQQAIEELASRGIINGVSKNNYNPDKTMTRAEFATIIVRALSLMPKASGNFKDVEKASAYAPFIGTAYSYGIVSGVTSDTFAPGLTITRQEAAVMVSNAAKLCGMNTTLEKMKIRDILAQFTDYVRSAEWARSGLAFCYSENILSQNDINIQPTKNVTRAEVADMVYKLLEVARLL